MPFKVCVFQTCWSTCIHVPAPALITNYNPAPFHLHSLSTYQWRLLPVCDDVTPWCSSGERVSSTIARNLVAPRSQEVFIITIIPGEIIGVTRKVSTKEKERTFLHIQLVQREGMRSDGEKRKLQHPVFSRVFQFFVFYSFSWFFFCWLYLPSTLQSTLLCGKFSCGWSSTLQRMHLNWRPQLHVCAMWIWTDDGDTDNKSNNNEKLENVSVSVAIVFPFATATGETEQSSSERVKLVTEHYHVLSAPHVVVAIRKTWSCVRSPVILFSEIVVRARPPHPHPTPVHATSTQTMFCHHQEPLLIPSDGNEVQQRNFSAHESWRHDHGWTAAPSNAHTHTHTYNPLASSQSNTKIKFMKMGCCIRIRHRHIHIHSIKI